jgi:predicted transcriptional regulator
VPAYEIKESPMTADTEHAELLALTAEIVGAHVANNAVAVSDLSALISRVFESMSKLGSAPTVDVPEQIPAVSIRLSVKPDHLVCLEDGRKQKTLKRHLMTSHGLTPDAYRAKWSLPADYPMVAPNYAAQRSAMAREIGLGRKPGVAIAAPSAPRQSPAAPKKRGRPKLGIAVS